MTDMYLIDGSLSLSDFPYDEKEEAEVNSDIEAALLLLAEMEENDMKREGLRITTEKNTAESHKPIISPSALTVTTDNRTGLQNQYESPSAPSRSVTPLNSHTQGTEALDIMRAFDILAEVERKEQSHEERSDTFHSKLCEEGTGSILAVTNDLNRMASDNPNSDLEDKKRITSPVKFKSAPPFIKSFSDVIDCDLDEDAKRALQIFAEMESKENEADAKRALEILAELEEDEKRRKGIAKEGFHPNIFVDNPMTENYAGNTVEERTINNGTDPSFLQSVEQEGSGYRRDDSFQSETVSPSAPNTINNDNHDNCLQEGESLAGKENLNSINISTSHILDVKVSREVPSNSFSEGPNGSSRQDIDIEDIFAPALSASCTNIPVSSQEDSNHNEFQQALKLLSDMENDEETRSALVVLGESERDKDVSLPNDEAESSDSQQLFEMEEPNDDALRALQILASIGNLSTTPRDETAHNASTNAAFSEEAENSTDLDEALRFLSNMEHDGETLYALNKLTQTEQDNGASLPYDEAENKHTEQTAEVVSPFLKSTHGTRDTVSDGIEDDTELALKLISKMENNDEPRHALEVHAQPERGKGTSSLNDEVDYKTTNQHLNVVSHADALIDDTQRALQIPADTEKLTITPRHEFDLNNSRNAALSDEAESSTELHQALKFLSEMESDEDTRYALEVLAQLEGEDSQNLSNEEVDNKNSMKSMGIASDIETPSDNRRALQILTDTKKLDMTPRSEDALSQKENDDATRHALKILSQLEGKRDMISLRNETISQRPIAPSKPHSYKDNADADTDLALQILAEMERREQQLNFANPSDKNSFFQDEMKDPLLNKNSPVTGRDIEEIIRQVNNIVVSDLTNRERSMVSEMSTSQKPTKAGNLKIQTVALAGMGPIDTFEPLQENDTKTDYTLNTEARSKQLLSESPFHKPPAIDTSCLASDTAAVMEEYDESFSRDNNSLCTSPVASSHDGKNLVVNSLNSSSRTTNCLSIGKSNGITFQSPFNMPDNPPRPRAESEILSTHSKAQEPTSITWIQATQSVIELINAVRGSSASRRCNACGTFKMLTLNEKNKTTLARTKGVLDTFRYVVELKPSPSCQYSLCSRIRILSAIYNLSTRAENRDLIVRSNLLPGLVHAAKDHNSEGRLISCSTLALLAKNEGNQVYMVGTPGLITVLSEVLGATAAGMVPVQKAHSNDEEATDEESEEQYSEEDTCSSSGSATDDTCESSDVSVADDKYVVCKSTQEEASLFVTPTRVSACAALIHLSKDCACIAQMCKNPKLLSCLANVCIEQEFEARTKSIEILCNLTRYPWNQNILASNESVMRSLIKCLKSSLADNRKWAARALQNICSDQSSKISIARQPLLSALGLSALSTEAEEQHAAVAALLNLSCEPGVVTAMSNTKNVVSTLIHLTYDSSTSAEVRLMACEALASIGLWLQTVAASANVPEGMEAKLPRSISAGWERYD